MLKSVWNGLSKTRDSIELERGPDMYDWRAAVAEIQLLEETLLTLQSTLVALPGLGESVAASQAELSSLLKRIESVEIGDEIVADIAGLKAKLEAQNVEIQRLIGMLGVLTTQVGCINSKCDRVHALLVEGLETSSEANVSARGKIRSELVDEIDTLKTRLSDLENLLFTE